MCADVPLAQSWAEAVAAIGTVGATVVALLLSTRQERKARREGLALAYARARLLTWLTYVDQNSVTVRMKNHGPSPVLDIHLITAWIERLPPEPFSQALQWSEWSDRRMLLPGDTADIFASVPRIEVDWSEDLNSKVQTVSETPRSVLFRFTDFEGTQWEMGHPGGPRIVRSGLLNPRRPGSNRRARGDARRLGPIGTDYSTSQPYLDH